MENSRPGNEESFDYQVSTLKDKVLFNPQKSIGDYSPLGLRTPMPEPESALPQLNMSIPPPMSMPSKPTKCNYLFTFYHLCYLETYETDWGALIKHNDELSRKFQNDQQSRRKERQQLYKDDLDYLRNVRDSQKNNQSLKEQTLIENMIR